MISSMIRFRGSVPYSSLCPPLTVFNSSVVSLKLPTGVDSESLSFFPYGCTLSRCITFDSQIIVGTIVQRVMGKVLSHDPVGIVLAHNSMGNIHSIQDMDSHVYGLVARLNRISKVSQRRGVNQSGGRCQIAWGTKQTTAFWQSAHSEHKVEIRECVKWSLARGYRPRKWSQLLTGGGRLLYFPNIFKGFNWESGRWCDCRKKKLRFVKMPFQPSSSTVYCFLGKINKYIN